MSEPPAAIVHPDLRYRVIPGFRPLLLDLTVPAGRTPAPLVVYLHGGGFVVGSHQRKYHRLAGELIDALVPRGIAVAAVGYRLSGEAAFPAPLHDIKAAVRWLRANAGEYGIDTGRFGAFGESAGGYFAGMLATTARVAELNGSDADEYRISAAVSWYGPTHLPTMPEFGPKSLGGNDPAASPESRYLGAVVASVPAVAELASPVSHVTADAAPLLMVHGTDDDGVPLDQSRRMADAYAAAGVPAELVVAEGAGHGFSDAVRSAELRRSADFLDQQLRGLT